VRESILIKVLITFLTQYYWNMFPENYPFRATRGRKLR